MFALTSLASGATSKRCGTLYTPRCTRPTIVVRVPTKCEAPGSTFSLPIKIHAIAGIRRIKITLGSTVLKSKTFKGSGPQNYTIKDLPVGTSGLSGGGHALTIYVKDVTGKTTTRLVRFSVCKPPPFTG